MQSRNPDAKSQNEAGFPPPRDERRPTANPSLPRTDERKPRANSRHDDGRRRGLIEHAQAGSPRERAWTDAELRLLGTLPDEEVAANFPGDCFDRERRHDDVIWTAKTNTGWSSGIDVGDYSLDK
jgi:hypothetical protein